MPETKIATFSQTIVERNGKLYCDIAADVAITAHIPFINKDVTFDKTIPVVDLAVALKAGHGALDFVATELGHVPVVGPALEAAAKVAEAAVETVVEGSQG